MGTFILAMWIAAVAIGLVGTAWLAVFYRMGERSSR